LIFLITIIEGPLITILAGWLSFLHNLNLWLAYIVVLSAELVADTLYYLLGYYGKEKIYRWFPKRFGGSREKIEEFEKMFHRHVGKSLIITKVTHVGGIPCLIAAGLARVPFSKFSFYNTVGTIPKISLLFFLGYFFGAAAGEINHYLEYGSFILTILVLVFVCNYFFLIPFAKRKLRKSK
jgi:membrane protein DedA with SNARE-associated domain